MSVTWRKMNKGKSYEDVISELHERVVALERLVLITRPNSKYPALAKAYEEYKIIEKLTLGNDQET